MPSRRQCPRLHLGLHPQDELPIRDARRKAPLRFRGGASEARVGLRGGGNHKEAVPVVRHRAELPVRDQRRADRRLRLRLPATFPFVNRFVIQPLLSCRSASSPICRVSLGTSRCHTSPTITRPSETMRLASPPSSFVGISSLSHSSFRPLSGSVSSSFGESASASGLDARGQGHRSGDPPRASNRFTRPCTASMSPVRRKAG